MEFADENSSDAEQGSSKEESSPRKKRNRTPEKISPRERVEKDVDHSMKAKAEANVPVKHVRRNSGSSAGTSNFQAESHLEKPVKEMQVDTQNGPLSPSWDSAMIHESNGNYHFVRRNSVQYPQSNVTQFHPPLYTPQCTCTHTQNHDFATDFIPQSCLEHSFYPDDDIYMNDVYSEEFSQPVAPIQRFYTQNQQFSPQYSPSNFYGGFSQSSVHHQQVLNKVRQQLYFGAIPTTPAMSAVETYNELRC